MKYTRPKGKRKLYYDLEGDSEHPPQCNMSLMGILEIFNDTEEIAHVWEAPFTKKKLDEIEFVLCDPTIEERVGFNCLNYDDLVLANYGITVPELNSHDAMLAIKTCYPGLPAHGLKFLCWLLLGDPHWAEFELLQTGHKWGDLVSDELKKYHRHDLLQHKNIWDYVKETVKKPLHWEAYQLDMRMKFPLQEITYEGGVWVDVERAAKTLGDLQKKKELIQQRIKQLSGDKIQNANSNRQVGQYLANVEDWELNLTGTGEFQVKKKDLADILGMDEESMRAWKPGDKTELLSPVAMLAWQMKDNETLRKYVQNYHRAAIETNQGGWIPSAYSISRAATRRTLSKSFYKINFQNSTEAIDEFKLIPPGYLGWFIDSTQIENVVHIYESEDWARRKAYEADENWNEYVWLANTILGTNKSKDELDSIKSKMVPHWSVYKAYKTAKLSMNFGQGARAFSQKLGFEQSIGKAIFADIHEACPAIRRLQTKVENLLDRDGYVQDAFGHIYTGPIDEAYKVVAYFVQGCGTGSLPKAQLRANYETEKWYDQIEDQPVGMLNSTTHDEGSGLLRLDLGYDKIHQILKDMMHNMTDKFSHKFDGIPLRAKLYLTTTNWHDRKSQEQKNWQNEVIYYV